MSKPNPFAHIAAELKKAGYKPQNEPFAALAEQHKDVPYQSALSPIAHLYINPTKPTDVPSSMKALENELAEVKQALLTLASRLEPVLDVDGLSPQPYTPRVSTIGLANSILELKNQAHESRRFIQSLLNALQV